MSNKIKFDFIISKNSGHLFPGTFLFPAIIERPLITQPQLYLRTVPRTKRASLNLCWIKGETVMWPTPEISTLLSAI